MSKKKVVKTIVKKRVIAKDKASDKVARVMGEFKDGKLKSSSGDTVTDKKQALAIALNEAGLSKSVFKSFEKVEVRNKIRVMKSFLEKKIQKEQAIDESLDNKIVAFMIANPTPADGQVHAFAEKIGLQPDKLEEKIYALLSSFLSGGKSGGKKFDVDMKELKMGINVEMEHTNNKILAGKIATDHLLEDKAYYTHLLEMENKYKVKKDLSDVLFGDSTPRQTCVTAVRG